MSNKHTKLKEIIDFLSKHNKARVRDLSVHLGTSEITVRRYLNELENEGIIKKFHGGAELVKKYIINKRSNYIFKIELEINKTLKNFIGAKAASLIQNGETAAFDNGTGPLYIVKNIPDDISLNAVCLTFNCAQELYKRENVNLILPGGYLNRETDSLYSDEAITFLSKTRTDKVFISPGGIDQKLGLTCYNDADSNLKRLMLQSSKEVIVIADSTKFGRVEPSHFADISEIDIIITDDGLSSHYRELLTNLDIKLYIESKELSVNQFVS